MPQQRRTGHLYHGRLTRAPADGEVYATIPRLTGDQYEHGPLPMLEPHDYLATGDPVLIGFLEGDVDQPVMLGRLVTRNTPVVH